MNIKRVKEEIKRTIGAYLEKDAQGAYVMEEIHQRPILLIGPPGIGKTAVMEQVARECGVGLVSYTITHHTRQSAIGLPYIETREFDGQEYRVTEYTMSEILGSVYEKMRQTGLREGILFIDEINCVSETLAPTMLEFLQAKRFGQHKVPQGWIICAAGNPPEYNRSVREFDVVTLDRVKKIEVDQDFDVWKEYAYQAGIHGAILSYLEIKKQNFYQVETGVDGIRFVTARAWEDLSQMIFAYERQGLSADRELIAQYVQSPEIAVDFANYLELWYKYRRRYDIEGVLAGETPQQMRDAMIRAAFDERISVIGMLFGGLHEDFKEISRQHERLAILHEVLKEYRDSLGNDAFTPQELFGDYVRAREERFAREQRAELLSREEAAVTREALDILQGWLSEAGDAPGHAEAFARMREAFGALRAELDEAQERAGGRLDHAFDFLENCFGDGQELVIFLTELTRNTYSMEYLNRYGNERFFKYNQMLLFRDREAELKEEIISMDGIW